MREENNTPVLFSNENKDELLIQIGSNKYRTTAENTEYSTTLLVSLDDKQAELFYEEYDQDGVVVSDVPNFKNENTMLASSAYWLKEGPGIKG